MVWARFDDSFPEHPKVHALSDGAGWLLVRTICLCCRYLTDGKITRSWANGHSKHLKELIAAGLVDEREDGLWIHDFDQFQPLRADVLARRETRARAGRLGAEKRWGTHGKQGSTPVAPPMASAIERGWQNDGTGGMTMVMPPARPGPYPEDKNPQREADAAGAASPARKFIPPTLEQVKEYWTEKGLRGDPELFWLTHENRYWKIDGRLMKDWRLAAQGWHRRENKGQVGTQPKAKSIASLSASERKAAGID